jgi:hypothetical protein
MIMVEEVERVEQLPFAQWRANMAAMKEVEGKISSNSCVTAFVAKIAEASTWRRGRLASHRYRSGRRSCF